eukprot:scaffold1445_cov235-Pinguiococcus_pyrenoidosus.AAC.3
MGPEMAKFRDFQIRSENDATDRVKVPKSPVSSKLEHDPRSDRIIRCHRSCQSSEKACKFKTLTRS